MQEVTVIIPNLNGMPYLKQCLDSLRNQSFSDFEVILIDNGSKDEGVSFVRQNYPEVKVKQFAENTGFCHAVNAGIRMAKTPFVLLLNNDTVCGERFVEELWLAIRELPDCFSCASKILQMHHPELMDDGGDYYCALGWAYAAGKGKPAFGYDRKRKIFAACAAAAIYRREVLLEIGLFDERHFAYLEDIDVAYRAKIAGYQNWYIPSAVVYHVGSATSGSAYNEFKVRYSSRNSVYLIGKNMPFLQILLNLPFLLAGYLIKTVFFARKGFLKTYVTGLFRGAAMIRSGDRVRFKKENLKNYVIIQLELWINMLRRFHSF
ncbi:MAG: glycosyltransferase family 2 protein [Lachnospiraceae bacterium]|nr:glycosyltransferase family 2 protein [Lachnospiraceae bacterium]